MHREFYLKSINGVAEHRAVDSFAHGSVSCCVQGCLLLAGFVWRRYLFRHEGSSQHQYVVAGLRGKHSADPQTADFDSGRERGPVS